MKNNYSKFLLIKKKYLFNLLLKTSLCISFLALVGFTTKAVYAQNSKVVIDTQKTVSIEEIFEILKQQTDHTFIYSVDLFKDKPKIALKKEDIENILESIQKHKKHLFRRTARKYL